MNLPLKHAPARTELIEVRSGIRVVISWHAFMQFAFVGFSLSAGAFLAFVAVQLVALAISGGLKAYGVG